MGNTSDVEHLDVGQQNADTGLRSSEVPTIEPATADTPVVLSRAEDLAQIVEQTRTEAISDPAAFNARARARMSRETSTVGADNPAQAQANLRILRNQELADLLVSPGQKFEYDKPRSQILMNINLARFPLCGDGQRAFLTDLLPRDMSDFVMTVRDKDGKETKVNVQAELNADGPTNYYFWDTDGSRKYLKDYKLPLEGSVEIQGHAGERESESAPELQETFTLGDFLKWLSSFKWFRDFWESATGKYLKDGVDDYSSEYGQKNYDMPRAYNAGDVMRTGSHILKYQPTDSALSILSKMQPNEPMVKVTNPSGRSDIELRSTTYECLQNARGMAQAEGYDIVVTSGYRSLAQQAYIYEKALAKNGGDASNVRGWVAQPGKSWHQTGGTADVQLVKKGDGKALTSAEDKERLLKYMNSAGFVNYAKEYWHFEIGSRNWEALVGNQHFASRENVYSRLA